ncbi:uncharacterized protein LOC116418924 isoform X1 [Piliocolobus tephrosceles]|uniref:uncharacterized protein LOC116418924 isoform X1 n=1 Tax=Piliocolobus tephrosceles TaxID=591936 RepID=UPI000C2A7A74|nr:uncharacterized protein LOC116418924 isoform X1 [Piliocolobus tephrosceles]XP_031792074.1 uncharacterized protein LOC116418924 isoform X1 [Piliocolobus tephrosceles]XP_031792075.1 uncharacterized protein LOC116418924 isoform X1 [Piliocolobus tephrosceles]XP_031792076.1 uncharacterized protein LOC116418924 isoform X1 [Piliocolobus tephrosceles]XP_031792077.1 uncharacterized protein LOC116418924 isoform X1 [Piliocolobus tephrosceles]XP_031792078.1 uncharacterized protein LOC116418924 isoform 
MQPTDVTSDFSWVCHDQSPLPWGVTACLSSRSPHSCANPARLSLMSSPLQGKCRGACIQCIPTQLHTYSVLGPRAQGAGACGLPRVPCLWRRTDDLAQHRGCLALRGRLLEGELGFHQPESCVVDDGGRGTRQRECATQPGTYRDQDAWHVWKAEGTLGSPCDQQQEETEEAELSQAGSSALRERPRTVRHGQRGKPAGQICLPGQETGKIQQLFQLLPCRHGGSTLAMCGSWQGGRSGDLPRVMLSARAMWANSKPSWDSSSVASIATSLLHSCSCGSALRLPVVTARGRARSYHTGRWGQASRSSHLAQRPPQSSNVLGASHAPVTPAPPQSSVLWDNARFRHPSWGLKSHLRPIQLHLAASDQPLPPGHRGSDCGEPALLSALKTPHLSVPRAEPHCELKGREKPSPFWGACRSGPWPWVSH